MYNNPAKRFIFFFNFSKNKLPHFNIDFRNFVNVLDLWCLDMIFIRMVSRKENVCIDFICLHVNDQCLKRICNYGKSINDDQGETKTKFMVVLVLVLFLLMQS